MKSPARGLQVGENFSRDEKGLVRLGPLEFADPGLFDNSEDEFPRFAFRGFVRGEIAEASLVDYLLLCLYQCLLLVFDGHIIYFRL